MAELSERRGRPVAEAGHRMAPYAGNEPRRVRSKLITRSLRLHSLSLAHSSLSHLLLRAQRLQQSAIATASSAAEQLPRHCAAARQSTPIASPPSPLARRHLCCASRTVVRPHCFFLAAETLPEHRRARAHCGWAFSVSLSLPSLVPNRIVCGLDACVTLGSVVTSPELNQSHNTTMFLSRETHARYQAHQGLTVA